MIDEATKAGARFHNITQPVQQSTVVLRLASLFLKRGRGDLGQARLTTLSKLVGAVAKLAEKAGESEC